YGTGIEVYIVNLLDAQPPDEVQASFADAIKAREDEERFKLEAEAYSNDILPRARGLAKRRLEEAQAYRSEVIESATGDASRFLQLMGEYQKAPGVTRQRLYLETMEEVYGDTNKVLIDADGSGSLMYLPIDKLIQQQQQQPRSSSTFGVQSTDEARQSQRDSSRRSSSRSRGDR
ncbi:MAG: protease modulator HflK, partial [Pseudomonadota bacterium]